MRILFFLFTLNLSSQLLTAQKVNVILDSLSRERIAYSSITCEQTGISIMSNAKGEWQVLDSLANCKTFTISCAGYETKFNVKAGEFIVLAPRIITLKPVLIGGKEKEIEYNNITKLNCSFIFDPEKRSTMYASYLPNTLGKTGSLTQLSFYVSNFHKPDFKVPVRIRFFEWDKVTQLPGKEISTQNLILYPKKKHWNNINLKHLEQEIPVNGIVVGFELISAGKEHYHTYTYIDQEKKNHTGVYYGWNLTASCCTDCEIKGFRLIEGKFSSFTWGVNKSWAPAVKLKMKYYE